MVGLPKAVTLYEVGPRDGLQNEARTVPLAVKLALIHRLAEAGLPAIEVGAFVSPRWVPQMADSAAVLADLSQSPPSPTVRLPVLVPNQPGFDRALAAGAREIAVFTAASEAFTARNINCTIAESFERFAPVCREAAARGIPVRGYVSCALGCPYQGTVAPAAVAAVAERLAELGCAEISLGDTIGVGTAGQTAAMIAAVAERVPLARLAIHCHDTYGQALANILAALQSGITIVDAAIAGLGGCPYAAGASGNVATEDVLYLLDGLGIRTGVSMTKLLVATRLIAEALGRKPSSRAAQALLAQGTGER